MKEISHKQTLKNSIFVCRRERWRRWDQLRLLVARRKGEKFASKRYYRFGGDGRKKHVQSMFNTRYDKVFKYTYKSVLNKNLKNEIVNLEANLGSSLVTLRSMKNYVVYLEKTALKSFVGTLRWFIKMNCLQNEIKCRVNVFPDFVLTAKPKEMRMGKGKGAPSHKIAPIKPGVSFLQIVLKKPVSIVVLNKLMNLVRAKLPFQTKFFYNLW